MEATQTKIESQAIELSTEAFDAFCEDIGGMFGIEMKCEQQGEVATETVKELKKRFKKLVAINSVKAEGALDGTFHLVFDQGGLFTTSGVIVMQPEKRILEQIKRGTAEDAEHLGDALGECGNLLVGSWDRVFREEMEAHGHFVQTNTYIGEPWKQPKETIGLDSDEEFLFASYEMTISPYPTFNCGVIFPKSIFEPASEPSDDQTVAPDETADVDKEQVAKKTEEKKEEIQAEAKEDAKGEAGQVTEEAPQETVETDKDVSADKPKPTEESPEVKEAAEKEESEAKQESEVVAKQETEEKAVATDSNKGPSVSEAIQEMTQSQAVLPGKHAFVSSTICAKDIMQKEVVWGSSDDSVQQVLTKMQQADVGYMLVGTDGQLEGLVSKSGIMGAVSIYLRPVFAKWRQPLDDATLQIKIKWIMSRPVHTIKPDATLAAVMENMQRYADRALPVMDKQGKIQGLITVFDIFKVLIDDNDDISIVGKTLQMPPLI